MGIVDATRRSPGRRLLEQARWVVALGSLTSLLLALASFGWAALKAVQFVDALLSGGGDADTPLVKLFESIDTVLIGTVMLVIGVGLWELFLGDLDLPPSLTVSSFDDLKAKVATTLLLVLVVRFLESLVRDPGSEQLLELGASVTLVGGLLLVFARWRPEKPGSAGPSPSP